MLVYAINFIVDSSIVRRKSFTFSDVLEAVDGLLLPS